MLTNTLYFAPLLNNQVTILSKLCSEFGITHVVICPGSRSAPLVFAFNRNKNFKTYTIIDERSAAYIALGMAQQLQKPVALICTSGTAAVNFYPAIAEAFYQKIPLVVLTADRPSELINQQDGQMINQINLFGSHVRASMQFSAQSSKTEVENVLEKSIGPVLGPVHINVPLTEPLYEDLIHEFELTQPKTTNQKTVETNLVKLEEAIAKSNKKIILVGQLLPDKNLNKVLVELQEKGFVILADVVSNQHENIWLKQFDFIIAQASRETLQTMEPDCIISLGGPVLSKVLKLWLKKQQPTFHFRIQQDGTLVNTYSNVTDYIINNPFSVLNSINNLPLVTNKTYSENWYRIEQESNLLTKQFVLNNTDIFNELTAVYKVLDHLPYNSQLHVANSTSIRYVSYLGLPQKNLTVFCNRGTSGIDGCSSTTVGAALINNTTTTLITGDLAFFYDRNAFWNNYVSNNLRVILLNNSGGGIFNLIDGPNGTPEIEQFFLTKHHLKAKNLAADFGLIYENCTSHDELNNALKTFFEPSDRAKILELGFDMEASAEVYKRFKTIKIDHSLIDEYDK